MEFGEALLRPGGEVLRYGWKQQVSPRQGISDGEVEVGGVAALPFGPFEAGAVVVDVVKGEVIVTEDAHIGAVFRVGLL